MQLVDKHTFCHYAVFKADYPALDWALNNNYFKYVSSLCTLAAEKGDLNLLKWLHQHGVPWNEETCQAAIRQNHFHVLKWAIERGCRTGKDLYKYALQQRNTCIADWLWTYQHSSAYTRCQVKISINAE